MGLTGHRRLGSAPFVAPLLRSLLVADELSAALAPVLRDLRTTGVVVPRIDAVDWAGEPEIVSAMLMAPDGTGTGVSILRADTPVERVVSTAGQVQEWAWEELWSQGAPTNWPVCPGHPTTHPMMPKVRTGLAAWVCPHDCSFVAPVGGLQP